MSVEGHAREQWGTRIGLVLAMAGIFGVPRLAISMRGKRREPRAAETDSAES